jgi:hypothetical protein
MSRCPWTSDEPPRSYEADLRHRALRHHAIGADLGYPLYLPCIIGVWKIRVPGAAASAAISSAIRTRIIAEYQIELTPAWKRALA